MTVKEIYELDPVKAKQLFLQAQGIALLNNKDILPSLQRKDPNPTKFMGLDDALQLMIDKGLLNG